MPGRDDAVVKRTRSALASVLGSALVAVIVSGCSSSGGSGQTPSGSDASVADAAGVDASLADASFDAAITDTGIDAPIVDASVDAPVISTCKVMGTPVPKSGGGYPPSSIPNGQACSAGTSCSVRIAPCPGTTDLDKWLCVCTSGTWECSLEMSGESTTADGGSCLPEGYPDAY